MPQLKIGIFLTLLLSSETIHIYWKICEGIFHNQKSLSHQNQHVNISVGRVGSLIAEVVMMEMSEGGGVGNPAFDATGDDFDSRQQQATQKVQLYQVLSP